MTSYDGNDCCEPTKTATILLMCGLPGSGKSTLTKRFAEHCPPTYRVVHVEYDELVARQLQQQISSTPGGDDQVVIEPCSIAEQDAANNEDDDDNQNSWLPAWRKSRKQALQLLQQELHQHFNQETNNDDDVDECRSNRHLIVIMDDNFFLRSMRRDVYKICQQQQQQVAMFHAKDDLNLTPLSPPLPKNSSCIYFGIIWMDASLDVCLTRNRNRLYAVSDETIVKMSRRLEPPHPEKAEFERQYLHIHGDDNHNHEKTDNNDATDFLVVQVMEFVEACRQSNPVTLPSPTLEEQEALLAEERRKTLESRRHTYDKILRAWVGQVARMDRFAASAANATRQHLLRNQSRRAPPLEQNGNDDIASVSELLEWFCEHMFQSPVLQEWSQEQKDQLRCALNNVSKTIPFSD